MDRQVQARWFVAQWRRWRHVQASAAFCTVLIFASLAFPALAQFPMLRLTEQPAPFVREAFASPYGRALVAEFGQALRADADPACLQAKGIAPEQLADRGGALLIAWGTRTMEKVVSSFDFKTYETKFAASAGPDAGAEMLRLREHPEVQRYLAIERPLRLAKVLDFVVEQFDRYALLKRIKIASLSPISTGNVDLENANPTEQGVEALDDFAKASAAPELRRLLALSEEAADAVEAALKTGEANLAGPNAFYRGVEADLAELCIGTRR
jgi:hypothetical protein